MKTTFVRRASAIVGLTAICAITFAASRPPAPAKGVTYRLQMTTRMPEMFAQMQQNGAAPAAPEFLARVKVIGKKARFDFVNVPKGTPIGIEDYVLMLDSVRAVFVNVDQKAYAEAPPIFSGGGSALGMLSQIAGRSRRRAAENPNSNVPQIELTGLDMDLQQLDGDTLQGRQVRHYALVAEMNVNVMNTTAPLRVEMEFWTADLPYNIVNPFDLSGSVSPDDPAAKFTARLIAMRKQIRGTPIKTVMNMTISGLGNGAVPPIEFGQTIQVLDLKEAMIESKELEIPATYTRMETTGRGRGGPR